MGVFKGAVITKKGQDLLAKLVQGSAKLTFTQIKTSENALKGDLSSLTNIGTVKQAEKVSSVTKHNSYTAKVSTSFSNKELTEGYYIRNIGLYAMDPTEGEILYSISVADESTATADWMPPYNGAGVSSLMVDLITLVSNSDKVTVEVDPTAFATVAQIMAVNEHLTALDNTIITTTESALLGSVAGGLKINGVYGRSIQKGEPTPDTPQDIKSVEVSEIKAVGKNLLKNHGSTTEINGITFSVNANGSIIANGTATARANYTLATNSNLPLKNGAYILSGCAGGSSETYRVQFWTDEVTFYCNDGETLCNFEQEGGSYNITIAIMEGVTVSNLTFYPMLRDASVEDNTYEPYTEKVITLSEKVPLSGVGGMCDSVVAKDGVYGVKRVFTTLNTDDKSIDTSKFVEMDNGLKWGLSVWVQLSALTGTNYRAVDFIKANKFTVVPQAVENDEDTGTCMSAYGHADFLELRFRFLKSQYPTADSALEALAGTVVHYPINAPVDEPLPVEDQISLCSLVGTDGVTCVVTDSIVSPTIEVEYGTNKTGAHTLTGLLTAQRIELKMSELT